MIVKDNGSIVPFGKKLYRCSQKCMTRHSALEVLWLQPVIARKTTIHNLQLIRDKIVLTVHDI